MQASEILEQKLRGWSNYGYKLYGRSRYLRPEPIILFNPSLRTLDRIASDSVTETKLRLMT